METLTFAAPGAPRKLRTTNFALRLEDVEAYHGPSVTVPDETMTIAEIMEKHTRGLRVAEQLYRPGHFEEDADLDSEDLAAASRLDLYDREELKADLAERIKQQKADLDKQEQIRLEQSKPKTKTPTSKKEEGKAPGRSERPKPEPDASAEGDDEGDE